MSDPYLTTVADRDGGAGYSKGTPEIYKFEKIKRAKRALAEHPELEADRFRHRRERRNGHESVWAVMGKKSIGLRVCHGIAAYKEAVKRNFGVELDPVTDVNHCIGSKPALAMLPAAFINPGDVTLMTVHSCWHAHPLLRRRGARGLPLLATNDFFPIWKSIPADVLRRAKVSA